MNQVKHLYERKVIGDTQLFKNYNISHRMENSIRLFKLRDKLKGYVFNILHDTLINDDKFEQFRKSYAYYVKVSQNIYPHFIFDEFNDYIYSELEIYIENNYSVVELEKMYLKMKNIY